MIPFAVLNSLASDVKKDSLRVNSVMILVVLSTHAEQPRGGASIGKRDNSGFQFSKICDITANMKSYRVLL